MRMNLENVLHKVYNAAKKKKGSPVKTETVSSAAVYAQGIGSGIFFWFVSG